MSSINRSGFIKDLFNLPHFTAGFIAVLVGYTSSAIIIFQAAEAAGASQAEISSWLWALGIGMGLTSLGLSLRYRSPVLTAWSTPGAALLVTSLSGVSLNEAIGIFIFSSALITISGLTGWFEKLMSHLPTSLAGAMLAGVLFQFALNMFKEMQTDYRLIGLLLLLYLIVKKILPRYTIPVVLLAGIIYTAVTGELQTQHIALELAYPIWISPEFSLHTLLGIGIPLFIVTMASQNIPGLAALKANGYSPPASPLISWTGIAGVILAPFGGFAYNLAAITAAICMSKEAGEKPEKRYFACIWAGVFYLFTGTFGASVALLFSAFPHALVVSVAGLALLSTIGNSLSAALIDSSEREAALITFLITASGLSLFGIGSAFWGVTFGFIAYFMRQK